jgi:elongation factor P
VKIIASSVRKGNVLEIDGKLYIVLTAESFHPGKGTPTTQIDMRRISDGVKTSQRYKTTEQVERAHVEDRPYQFLYSDGEGFHFMNMENYDQIQVPADVIGDAKAYLEPEMMVKLSVFENNAVAIELPQRAILEVVETEPGVKGDTVSNVTKPATLETGAVIQVPLFVNTGDKLKVDPKENRYIQRA